MNSIKGLLQKVGLVKPDPKDAVLGASALNIQVNITGCTFSGGQRLGLDASDIIVIVGPNNSGKSAALRNILQKLVDLNAKTEVITEVEFNKRGTLADLKEWVRQYCHVKERRINHLGLHSYTFDLENDWEKADSIGFGDLARILCVHITVETRLTATSGITLPDTLVEGDTHPAHKLYRHLATAERLSGLFKRAFNEFLVVNTRSGSRLRLHVTPKAILQPSEPAESDAWIDQLSALPLLENQGDGMKSFFSVLLYTTLLESKILLLDEPEVFLHPPQANLLGELLPEVVSGEKQLFIATHSGDIIKGMLNTGSTRVKVVSVRRPDKVTNVATFLDNNDLREVWKDPFLRSSNLIEGLFHDKVILCESDGDCRFYQALSTAIESKFSFRVSDVLFTHCNGKSRLAVAVRALRKLGIPLRVIVDFDILQDANEVKKLYNEAGGNWEEIAQYYRKVHGAVEACLGALKVQDARAKINEELDKAGERNSIVTDSHIDRIKEILNTFSPWRQAKTAGRSLLPNGEPTQCFNALVAKLREHNIFVVEEGELESFVKSVSKRRKAEWLDAVMKRDLATDPEVDQARSFVQSVLS